MSRFTTAQEHWDNHPDKDTFYWKSSGQYTYQTLLEHETTEKQESKITEEERERQRQIKKFKES